MKNFDEIMAKAEKNEAILKELAANYLISPKGVKEAKWLRECLMLDFGHKAVERAYVEVDWQSGEYRVNVGCWTALTDTARERIEAKRFADAKEALMYALDTFGQINRFFDTIGE